MRGEATLSWERLKEAASQPDAGQLGLGAWLLERLDPALYRPEAAPGVVVSCLAGREGTYYVLKNSAASTYYRMNDRDYFLWQRMDGSRTVKDLVVAYFLEYGSFAFARVAALTAGLKAGLFLKEKPVNVYWRIQAQLQHRRPAYRLGQLGGAFLQKQLAVKGLDHWLAGVYRWGGWLLFTRPVQILYLVVSLVGLYAFVRALDAGQYGVVTIAGSYQLGIIGLIAANLVAIFLHEMAHALTVKHYGREVRRGGFMIYFGLPAFFVDTTDIWLEGKRARLAVTWAGPYSGLILGGLASIALVLIPEFSLNALLFQFAFLCFMMALFNFNPLLELDGYYLLMDSLEIPMLRRRSLEFLREGLWQKVRRAWKATGEPLVRTTVGIWAGIRGFLGSFSREEKIFTLFGLLSAAWTLYAIYLGAYFWQQRLAGALRDLWAQEGGIGKTILALATVALGLVFVLSIGLLVLRVARGALGWATRRGLLAKTWNVAALLLIAVAGLALAPGVLGTPVLAQLLGLASLAAAALFAGRNARDYAGARLARVFWLLGLCSSALLAAETTSLALDRGLLVPGILDPALYGLSLLAIGCLLLAGLFLFAGGNPRELGRAEKGLLLLGLAVTCGLGVELASRQQAMGTPLTGALLTIGAGLVPLLTLTLLVPTLFSFWRTAFAPAWAMLGLALIGLAAVPLLDLPRDLSYLLLATSLFLHHLAYRRLPPFEEEPQAELDLSDQQRLQEAFGWTAVSLTTQFRQIAGERPARAVMESFDRHAAAAGWQIGLLQGRVEDSLSTDLSLLDRGEVYAAALSLLLDLMAQEAGEKLAVRSLQRAYDGLPWEAREIGAQYLFRDIKRAESLSQEFQSTCRDYQRLLRRMPLFATVDEDEIDLLCARLKREHVASGQTVIRQGQVGDKFYIIRRGHVEVSQRDERGISEVVNQLDRGDFFGEVALLRDAPRNATCRATVPTELLSLSRQDFDRLVRGRFALREKVDQSIAGAELLRRTPLFAELDGRQIQLLAAQMEVEAFEPGQSLIRQGDAGETFYLIEAGRVQVSVTQNGGERIVAERGPGEYVGEIALLLDVPRTATVRALAPTRTRVLHRADFDRLVGEHLYVSRGLERDTSRRLIDLRRATEPGNLPTAAS